jgi:hypothetical protein
MSRLGEVFVAVVVQLIGLQVWRFTNWTVHGELSGE